MSGSALPLLNLRQFISRLREAGEVVDIYEEVDSSLEIAEIHRRVAEAEGPVLFFHNVKGSSFPVVTNLFGSTKRIDLAFQNRPDELIATLVELLTHNFPPKIGALWQKRKALKSLFSLGTHKTKRAAVKECRISPVDLEKIPLIKSWPLDGGHFITLPLVYTEPLQGGGPHNLGMYRIQRYNKSQTGLHFQIQKGGGFHYHQAEQLNLPLPVTIFIGGPPALILSAITPLPENVPELLIASLMQGKKLKVGSCLETPHSLIAECEFALVGKAPPHIRKEEGPFGDHYGYYSLAHDFPLFECEAIYHRKGAIYPATVVGKPKQEDFYIGDYLQKLLSPLFPVVMPGVKSLWSYGETGFHALSAAIVKERYYRECMASAFRILGEGQLSLTKFLLLTDREVDVQDFKTVLTTVLERFRPETDLFIFSNLSLDTLDYTGPKLNQGSRGVMLGIGEKIRELPTALDEPLPPIVRAAAPFSPGCLVLELKEAYDLTAICSLKSVQKWPLLIVVDDVAKTVQNSSSFLWTVFTRFEPAADITSSSAHIVRNHLSRTGPILIDARMKASYPPVVECDEQTATLVSSKWNRYGINL